MEQQPSQQQPWQQQQQQPWGLTRSDAALLSPHDNGLQTATAPLLKNISK
jgi:hypothetical protein